jgi:hypothetical protein
MAYAFQYYKPFLLYLYLTAQHAIRIIREILLTDKI